MTETQLTIEAWANATFPKATIEGKAAHLVAEAVELAMACGLDLSTMLECVQYSHETHQYNRLSPANECADVAILCNHIASHFDVNLEDAIDSKMYVNRQSDWGIPNHLGFTEHLPTD